MYFDFPKCSYNSGYIMYVIFTFFTTLAFEKYHFQQA